jgi:ATP synthase protein I
MWPMLRNDATNSEKSDNEKPRMTANCGIEFCVRIAVGAAIGIFLDRFFNTKPIFLIIFFLFGCAAGYLCVLECFEKKK